MTDYFASKKTKVKFVGIKNNETNFPDDILIVEDLEKIIEFL